MGIRFPHISWNSIRLKLVAGLVLVTVPLLTLLIYNNYYSINVVHNQVAISNKNLISLYMGQIDTQLEAAEKNVLGLATLNFDIQSMDSPNSEDDYQLAKHNLSLNLLNNILFYKSIDAFFIFQKDRQDLLSVSQSSITYSEKVEVDNSLIQHLNQLADSSKPTNPKWYVKEIGNTFYILRTIKSGNLYIGAWVKAKTLLGPMSLIDLGTKGSALLVTAQGEPMVNTTLLQDEQVDLSQGFQQYYFTGRNNNILVVGEASQRGDFALAATIMNEQILQNLPMMTQLIRWLSFAAIALLPLSLMFLHRILLVPLKRLIKAMNRINKGFVNVRIGNNNTSDEFLLVNQTFDRMMSQIEELKINVYEEQLSKQKAELQHLQLQINPHFFMNTLNILFNLAQVKNYELIQEMTLCLVGYFRFMFRSNLSFVSLKEELQHVRNYIRIQEMRFPDQLKCRIEYPDFLEEIQIPPLLIQTFLENSIKYGITLEEPLDLSVTLDLKETSLTPYVEIIIRDTGRGFSDQVLADINLGNRIVDEQGEHIGIWNVKKRLSFLYGENASISCYNGYPNGAVIEIKLPYQEEAYPGDGSANVSNIDR
ncbi:two-component sensor histidine kinase [Paenibacillus helianthi]|uniref:Two-component sensor histidine kinase n=1 Tax=Paenibacillus helianthi TaxID=1349432 RepID=A0ABX3EG10_9BACL|nr:histidine kinase [Paenibacillus helianthi]OKP80755.1 two-component sensor histidine kinase [Paenibacillus helianthi]